MIPTPRDSFPEKPPKIPHSVGNKMQISWHAIHGPLQSGLRQLLLFCFPGFLGTFTYIKSRRHSSWPWLMRHLLLQGLGPGPPTKFLFLVQDSVLMSLIQEDFPELSCPSQGALFACSCAYTYSIMLYLFIIKICPLSSCSQFSSGWAAWGRS